MLAELRGPRGGPFGDAAVHSNLIKAGVSRGLQEAAGNLLAKALRAVAAGDEPRARGYVQRAVELPVDEHEEVHPGRWAASMLLFEAVTDALEACEEGDPVWLDAADQALRTSTITRGTSYCTLWTIASDYRLPHREARRIRDMLGGAELRDWPLREPSELAVTVPEVFAVIRAVLAYHDALAT